MANILFILAESLPDNKEELEVITSTTYPGTNCKSLGYDRRINLRQGIT